MMRVRDRQILGFWGLLANQPSLPRRFQTSKDTYNPPPKKCIVHEKHM